MKIFRISRRAGILANICSVVLNSVSSDTRVLKQADTLARAGHRVTIVGIRDKADQPSREILPNGVVIVRCNYSPRTAGSELVRHAPHMLWKARGMAAMLRAIIRAKPNILHCHDVYTLPLGPLGKLLLSCRLVYDAHEIYEEVADVTPAQAYHFGRIHLLCAWACDGFVTINSSIAAWYARHHPRLPDAVVVMNAAPLQKPNTYDGRLHRAAGLPPEVNILLFQGGLKPHRGLEETAKAAGHLPLGWAVVMMGHGELEEFLRSAAGKINQRDRGHPSLVVIPPAPLAELPLWTAGATLGLIPYANRGINHWYCTPNKLWEYPSAGVPVLASPFPEMKKLIHQYGFGWLLDHDWDGAKMADQVTRLSRQELALRRQNCAEFMSQDNWDKYGDRLLELYEGLLA